MPPPPPPLFLIPELDRCDRHGIEFINLIKERELSEALREKLLDPWHIERRDHRIELARLVLQTYSESTHVRRFALLIHLVHNLARRRSQVDLDTPLCEVIDDRVVQIRLKG